MPATPDEVSTVGRWAFFSSIKDRWRTLLSRKSSPAPPEPKPHRQILDEAGMQRFHNDILKSANPALLAVYEENCIAIARIEALRALTRGAQGESSPGEVEAALHILHELKPSVRRTLA